MATAAAPTYFPAHTLQVGSTLVDGGVWANNPTGLAVVEGVATLAGNPKTSGSSVSAAPTSRSHCLTARALGAPSTARHRINDARTGRGSLGTAKIMLGHSETSPRLFRRSQVVNRDTFRLDAAGQVAKLAGLGREDARQFVPTYRRVFMEEYVRNSYHFTEHDHELRYAGSMRCWDSKRSKAAAEVDRGRPTPRIAFLPDGGEWPVTKSAAVGPSALRESKEIFYGRSWG